MTSPLLDIPAQVILNHTNDGIYVTDLNCTILFWNQPAENITGWKAEEVLGKQCSQNILIHVDGQGNELCKPGRCPLHHSMARNQPTAAPVLVWAQKSDGSRVPVEVSAAPLHDELGQVVGGVEVFRDASERVANLERARFIQAHSLPSQLPSGPVSFAALYQPHEVVGGDYYQVRTLEDGRHAFILADVAGHGVAASLYTMTLHVLWQELKDLLPHPGAFMSKLNQELSGLFVGDSFATAFLGLVDGHSGEIIYASAGHPPPLLRHAKGEMRELANLDMPLAMLEDTEYHEAQTQLPHGGALLVYSDSALETGNPQGAEFGLTRLKNLLKAWDGPDAQAFLGRIHAALLRHSETVKLNDDLTLLAITRREQDI